MSCIEKLLNGNLELPIAVVMGEEFFRVLLSC